MTELPHEITVKIDTSAISAQLDQFQEAFKHVQNLLDVITSKFPDVMQDDDVKQAMRMAGESYLKALSGK